jgi:hypothetical protein
VTSISTERLGLRQKLAVGARIWWTFLNVAIGVRRHPLPILVSRLSTVAGAPDVRIDPRRMGRIVGRGLRIGPWRPRCLFGALTLYRMLVRQGERVELVIGLPDRARSKDAHAWVEVAGVDVGPPPGRAWHEPLARYGPTGPMLGLG